MNPYCMQLLSAGPKRLHHTTEVDKRLPALAEGFRISPHGLSPMRRAAIAYHSPPEGQITS